MTSVIGEQILEETVQFFPILIKLERWLRQCGCGEVDLALPPSQLSAMILLKSAPGLSMTQLAEQLYMPRQQLTKIVDSLAKRGLVERRTNPQNRRVVLLEVSQVGGELLRATFAQHKDAMLRFYRSMSPAQGERLFKALHEIKDILSDVTDKSLEGPKLPSNAS